MKTWWLYVTAVFLIAAIPGPNMLHVTVQSVRHGPRPRSDPREEAHRVLHRVVAGSRDVAEVDRLRRSAAPAGAGEYIGGEVAIGQRERAGHIAPCHDRRIAHRRIDGHRPLILRPRAKTGKDQRRR